MNSILLVVVGLLVTIIVVLVFILLHVVKKATYLSKKEKEFIEFAIDMYVDYAEELNITDPEQHELIVKNLKKIKEENI